MDTFFSTKKGGKSSYGNICCQLFVTDKGFVYVVPMCNKSKVMQAVKLFAKEVAAPDVIISDMSGEQTSKDLRKVCAEISTMLKFFEEGTLWSNKAELYLKIVKESLQHPAGRIADPNPNANGATIPTPAFVFGACSQTHLATTAKCIQFYGMIDCPIDHLNIHWTLVVKNFDIQWKALVDCKKSNELDIPKITQTLPVLKWAEAFSDYLH